MKSRISIVVLLGLIFNFSCTSHEGGPFNYDLIKSKLDLSEGQVNTFDEITDTYISKMRAVLTGEGGREEKLNKIKVISAEQDEEMKEFLSEDQFEIYKAEIAIERSGREKYNMSLIRDQLDLDSTQTGKFNLANEAFYTTLNENHDYYHGKMDVYLQYYKEIDASRQNVFKGIMTDEKYILYKKLEDEFKIGKTEL